MSIIYFIFFLLSAYLASVFATVCGFGSSTLMIPVALFFIEAKSAILLVACFHLFNNLFKVRAFKENINWRICILFGLPSIIFAYWGATLMSEISAENMEKGIGVFLIAVSVFFIINPTMRFHDSVFSCLLGGGLSGFFAGLVGLGGTIRAFVMINFPLSKEVYIATSALIALVIDFTRIPTYFFSGVQLEQNHWVLMVLMIFIARLGVKSGKILVLKINVTLWRKIVYFVLMAMGLKLILF